MPGRSSPSPLASNPLHRREAVSFIAQDGSDAAVFARAAARETGCGGPSSASQHMQSWPAEQEAELVQHLRWLWSAASPDVFLHHRHYHNSRVPPVPMALASFSGPLSAMVGQCWLQASAEDRMAFSLSWLYQVGLFRLLPALDSPVVYATSLAQRSHISNRSTHPGDVTV